MNKTLHTPPKDFFNWSRNAFDKYWYSEQGMPIETSYRESGKSVKKLKKSLSKIKNFISRVYIHVDENRIEIQTYGFWQSITQSNDNQYFEKIEQSLVNFEVFENDEVHQYTLDYYANDRYIQGMTRMFGFTSGYYTYSEVYPNQWFDEITNTHFKYLDLDKLKKVGYPELTDITNTTEMINQLREIYKYRHQVEMLQKNQLDTFAHDYLWGYVDKRFATLKNIKKLKRYLRDEYKNGESFKLLVRVHNRGYQLVKGGFDIKDSDFIQDIPKEVNLHYLQKYLRKQKQDLQYWIDYIEICKKLEMDLIEHYPQSLTVAHDSVVKALNIKLDKESSIKLKKAKKLLERLQMESEQFMIIAPKSTREITQEGNVLNHCVGNYVDRVLNGETAILFVRDKNEPSKPFYTLEVKENKIIQCRGKHNLSYTDNVEVTNLLNEYQNKVLNTRRKTYESS